MPYRHRVLALLFLLIFVMYLDRLCISVAGPRIQQDLRLNPVQWGWVIGAFTIAYAAFEIPSGALGDRIGPRRVLTRIVLWWSVFTAATGLVSSYPVLLLVRFLFGAGEAGSFPNSALTISRWTPKQERARSLSVLWIATGLGGVATPLIVVAIQKRYGWRPSFYLFGSLGILWSAAWYGWFRDRPAEKPGVPMDEMKLIGEGSPARQGGAPWATLLRDRNIVLLMLIGLPRRSRDFAGGLGSDASRLGLGMADRSRPRGHEWNAAGLLVARSGPCRGACRIGVGRNEHRWTDRLVSLLGGIRLHGSEFRQLRFGAVAAGVHAAGKRRDFRAHPACG